MALSAEDLLDLHYARSLLEHPSIAARLTSMLGTPIERAIEMLPSSAGGVISSASQKAIGVALDAALKTIDGGRVKQASERLHKLVVAATGAAGGAFGLAALAVELPVTTGVIMRSILDVARSEGEDVRSVEARLACIEVLAIGGTTAGDEATDVGYFAVRAAMAHAVHEAATHLASRGVAEGGAPAIVRLIGMVASRFGVVVSEKLAAQLVPLVGAAGGALVNTIFIDHFQATARGHFIVRRLERVHGEAEIRRAYAETE
jgi:hypothetical protein